MAGCPGEYQVSDCALKPKGLGGRTTPSLAGIGAELNEIRTLIKCSECWSYKETITNPVSISNKPCRRGMLTGSRSQMKPMATPRGMLT